MAASNRSIQAESTPRTYPDERRAPKAAVPALTGLTKATEHSILSRALDAIWIIDETDIVRYLNPAAETLTGYAAAELIGRPISSILPSSMPQQHVEYIKAYLKRGGESRVLGRVREFAIVSKHGEEVPVELTAFEIKPEGPVRRFSGIMRDIRARKKLEAEREELLDRLEKLAWIDELTGLTNRRGFLQEADKLSSYARRYGIAVSLAIVDLDHFKRVNDTYGHGTGDEVLRRIAEICRRALRHEDTIGRIGGEEFGVLCPGAEPETARSVLERLCRHVASAPISLTGPDAPQDFEITVSAGIARLEADAPVEDTLRKADAALYDAKNQGRNRVCVQGAGEP